MPQHVFRNDMFLFFVVFFFKLQHWEFCFVPQLEKKDCDYPAGKTETLKELSNVWLLGSVVFFVTVQAVWRLTPFILMMLATSLSVRISVQGSDSLQGWPQWGVTLCLPLLSQGEFMFTAALSLSFAWYGLLANFQCAWTTKGTETDSSAQRKRKGCFFCHYVKHFNTPQPFWKF